MKEISPLFSEYIINGVPTGTSPGKMLDECIPEPSKRLSPDACCQPIVDETVDPAPCYSRYDTGKVMEYLARLEDAGHQEKSPDYPQSSTRKAIATSVIDAIWKTGHFNIDDIEVDAHWEWETSEIGNMAKFFLSAEAASRYIYDLGLRIRNYSFSTNSKGCSCSFPVEAVEEMNVHCTDDEDFGVENLCTEEGKGRCWIGTERKCRSEAVPEKGSWLIYIPFDTCPYRLGDSLLTDTFGNRAETAPEIQDPDYFIDCYEVVRELVEDGVVLSGVTVSRGGLLSAVKSVCGDSGMDIDISGIQTAYSEPDILRILFGETPGVLIQIADEDYDYIDSQLLLQDLAYYPLGHPGEGKTGITIIHGKKPGVSDILASLIKGQFSEGED